MVKDSALALLAPPEPMEPMEDTFYPTMSVIASAVRYPGRSPRIFVPPKPWQLEAYRHYGICGEARFASNWIGNALSRVTLHVVDSIKTKKKLEAGEPVDALDDLFNGQDGQVQMMQAMGLHLTIAGECYLVGRTIKGTVDGIGQEGTPGEVWEVLAVTEVNVHGGVWSITDREQEGKADIDLGEDDVVIRMWRPNPSRRREADSPFRSLLPVLSEIEWATRHIFAQLSSRLAGAGLLFVSDGIQIAAVEDDTDPDVVAKTQNTATALMQALATGMMRPLTDPSAPEALVPLILTVPEELLKSGKIAELMHFWSELDAESQNIRSAAITRFADGMDIPAEKLRGISTGDSTGGGRSVGPNHWGMWQVDEEAITLHIEPMAEIVCNFLTVCYERPLLADGSLEAVWYDSSALRLRPDRSKESIELYNLGLISGKVVVKENRFNPETEMMDEQERKDWLVMKVATGMSSATPEQLAAAFKILGIDMPAGDPGEDTRGPKAPPSIEDHPVKALPEAASLLLHTCEPIVLRALERAGNRLRQAGGKPPGVPSYLTHTVLAADVIDSDCLADAFTGTAEMCLAGVAEHAAVIPVLESYVKTLIAERAPHERTRLAEWLSLAGLT